MVGNDEEGKNMTHAILYNISAALLFLGFLGHTLGGMFRTAKYGVESGAEADEVFKMMKNVEFNWRGTNCTWFNFWMGNGLGVSALLILAIVVLYTVAGLTTDQAKTILPIIWAIFLSLSLLSFLGFKYFLPRIGIVFGLIALLVGIANIQVILS